MCTRITGAKSVQKKCKHAADADVEEVGKFNRHASKKNNDEVVVTAAEESSQEPEHLYKTRKITVMSRRTRLNMRL